MNKWPQNPEPRNESRKKEARHGLSMAISLLVMAWIVADAWSSGEYETYWLAILIFVTDLFLVALLAILAEQMTTAEPRKRWQLSLGKLLQLTAAIGIYLGLARFAYLNSIPIGQRMDPGSWIVVLVAVAMFVVASFPVILCACEGLIWVMVDVQKTNVRRKNA